jgi:hypothetical protein
MHHGCAYALGLAPGAFAQGTVTGAGVAIDQLTPLPWAFAAKDFWAMYLKMRFMSRALGTPDVPLERLHITRLGDLREL